MDKETTQQYIFKGLFLIAVVFGTVMFVKQAIYPSVQKIELPDQTNIVESIIQKASISTLEKNEAGYTNILVLGIGGNNHQSGYLTDTVMLVGFSNIEENPHYIFSIPRDLWVESKNKDKFTKINELYKEGGGTETPDSSKTEIIKEKVSQITGQQIHYTAVIDLIATEKIADFVGGVTIDGTHYTRETLREFLKDRYIEGGDFTRMQNQQKVIVALLQKIETDPELRSVENLNAIYAILQNHVSVDLNVTDYFGIYSSLENITPENITSYTITPNTNNLLQHTERVLYGFDVYALIPTAGQGDYTEISNFITNSINGNLASSNSPQMPPLVQKEIIEIENNNQVINENI